MRILYFTHQYLPRHVGGTELYTRGLATRAQAAGHDVGIVTYHELPSADPARFGLHRTDVDGIPVWEVHYALGAATDPARYEYQNPKVAEWIRPELESFAPEVVHAVHTMKLSVSPIELCVELRIPVVATLCDFWPICPRHTLLKWDGTLCPGPHHWTACLKCCRDLHGFADVEWVRDRPDSLLRWLAPYRRWRAARHGQRLGADLTALRDRNRTIRRVFLEAHRIIALSAFQKRMFVRNGFPAQRIEVITHGIETAPLESVPRRTRASERLTVLFLGSIVEHKGLHILLDALTRSPELEVTCQIYGAVDEERPYPRRIRALAERDSRVELRGTYAPADEGRVFAQTDLLVLPALWYENEPMVVKSALHLGVPVLASDIGSLREMIEPGRNGWLVPPGDPEALARELDRIARLPRPFGMESRGVKSMEENAAEMFRVYRELIEEDGSPASGG